MSTTKLEAMVDLLAGREVAPALLEELADPASESSRFLEATRLRSRALLGELPAERAPSPSSPGPPQRGAFLALGAASLLALVALGWMADTRLRRLEAAITRRDEQARAGAARLEETLSRLREAPPSPPETLEAAVRRVDASLARLDRESRAEGLGRAIAPIREEVAALRLGLSTLEKADTLRFEELQASIHDSARVLRLLLNRAEPPMPTPTPPSGGEPRRKSPGP